MVFLWFFAKKIWNNNEQYDVVFRLFSQDHVENRGCLVVFLGTGINTGNLVMLKGPNINFWYDFIWLYGNRGHDQQRCVLKYDQSISKLYIRVNIAIHLMRYFFGTMDNFPRVKTWLEQNTNVIVEFTTKNGFGCMTQL